MLMCQGYTRTALFEGFAGKALYPETVADEIVKAVLAGKSKHMALPETAWHIVPRVRSMPLWLQYSIRKKTSNLMTNWKGRQVAQPSEAKEKDAGEGLLGEGERKVDESAVLVGA